MRPTSIPNFDNLPHPSSRPKPAYFADHRKGEVGELRLLLRKMLLDSKTPSTTEKFVSQIVDPNVDHFKLQATKRRREILKRLIGCMTMGIDLSSLYTDVVMVSQTDDPVQKKMIYLYLSNYSMNNPDLAILAINTLLKDVESLDPVIRSLALRNLSSFGTNLSNEYATVSVLKKMFDPSDSVKRTAIIGSIRIYKSNCETYGIDSRNTYDLLQDLKTALRSSNVHVMVDAMCAVSEIAEYDKKIALSTPTVIYLTNCLKNMDEWEQCSILELLWTYKPANRDEMFDLMNLLDDKLKHNSTALFLSTAKCFLMWTKDDLFLQLEVVKRLQDPFMSLITRNRNELSYFLLANILSLIVNVTQLLLDNPDFTDDETSVSDYDVPFVDYFEAFYCYYDDPMYIKQIKLNILVSICTEKNCLNIIRELNEYVSDPNHDIANKSITALGIIALKLPGQLPFLIGQLSEIYNFKLPHLNSSVLYVIRTLLSVYPEYSYHLLEIIKEPSDLITYPEAKAHHIAILGDYGWDLDHTPYTLEDYIDDPNRTDAMTLELLPASVKVFLKRPAEMHESLSRLLNSVLNDNDNPDLISSANFYYNLLLLGVEETKKVLFEEEGGRVEPDRDFLLGQPNYFTPDPEWREHFNTVYLIDGCKEFYTSNNPVFFPFEHKDVPTDIFRDDNLRKVVEDYSPRGTINVNIQESRLSTENIDKEQYEDNNNNNYNNNVDYNKLYNNNNNTYNNENNENNKDMENIVNERNEEYEGNNVNIRYQEYKEDQIYIQEQNQEYQQYNNEYVALLDELENEIKYFNLINPNTLMSDEFQKIWFEIENTYSSEMGGIFKKFNLEELEEEFTKLHIITLASGTNKDLSKLYMYTEDKQGLVYYIEIMVNCSEEGGIRVTVKVKEDEKINESVLQSFAEILCDFVNRWINR